MQRTVNAFQRMEMSAAPDNGGPGAENGAIAALRGHRTPHAAKSPIISVDCENSRICDCISMREEARSGR